MRRAWASLLCLPTVTLVGCGYARAPAPSLSRPLSPQGFRVLSFPGAGVALEAPQSWTRIDEPPPLVAVLTSGSAVVALWRYVRARPLPSASAQLSAAARSLIGAVRAGQPAIQIIRTRVVRLGGAPGIELDALERIRGQLRRVRSTHLYRGQSEIVLEEYAPVDQFHSVDHAVFSPLRHSLRIIGTS